MISAGDKTEVRVIAQKKKTFHVPVSLTRIAPFHVVLGQRTVRYKDVHLVYNIMIVNVV